CPWLESGLLEQKFQRDAGLLHAMHHAMRVLTAIELGAAPFHPRIGRAFEEMDPVDARKALELVQREDQWFVDNPMQHQAVIVWINFSDPAVMAFEAQAVWGDDAVKLMQRGEAHR